jgi:hypothetical protein
LGVRCALEDAWRALALDRVRILRLFGRMLVIILDVIRIVRLFVALVLTFKAFAHFLERSIAGWIKRTTVLYVPSRRCDVSFRRDYRIA